MCMGCYTRGCQKFFLKCLIHNTYTIFRKFTHACIYIYKYVLCKTHSAIIAFLQQIIEDIIVDIIKRLEIEMIIIIRSV